MAELSMQSLVGVAGAGVMGQGIAALFAQQGWAVRLYDPHGPALARARQAIDAILAKAEAKGKLQGSLAEATSRLAYTQDLHTLQADLIVEAAPERLDLKHDLLRQLEANNPAHTLLATNTSSIPIARLAAVLAHPNRCAGFHFFNPVAAMQLAEVVQAPQTDPAVIDTLLALARQLGKQPVRVHDAPGFIVNRVARPFYLEAQRIVQETGASYATIDAALEAAGFRMGPFRLMDLIGIDTNHEVSQRMYEAFFQHPRFRPSPLQQARVDAGLLGRKTGQGWYAYPAE